jgi:hypothetical protein
MRAGVLALQGAVSSARGIQCVGIRRPAFLSTSPHAPRSRYWPKASNVFGLAPPVLHSRRRIVPSFSAVSIGCRSVILARAPRHFSLPDDLDVAAKRGDRSRVTPATTSRTTTATCRASPAGRWISGAGRSDDEARRFRPAGFFFCAMKAEQCAAELADCHGSGACFPSPSGFPCAQTALVRDLRRHQ